MKRAPVGSAVRAMFRRRQGPSAQRILRASKQRRACERGFCEGVNHRPERATQQSPGSPHGAPRERGQGWEPIGPSGFLLRTPAGFHNPALASMLCFGPGCPPERSQASVGARWLIPATQRADAATPGSLVPPLSGFDSTRYPRESIRFSARANLAGRWPRYRLHVVRRAQVIAENGGSARAPVVIRRWGRGSD
jgi:hypothetical protein